MASSLKYTKYWKTNIEILVHHDINGWHKLRLYLTLPIYQALAKYITLYDIMNNGKSVIEN